MLSKLIVGAFVLVLLAGVPALAWSTARRPEVLELPRRALYFSAVFSEWLIAALGVLAVYFSGEGFAGFRPVAAGAFAGWTALVTLLTLAALGAALLLEKRGWWPEEPELVRRLIPETRVEKIQAVLMIAPTAALCEEFLYRGFLFSELWRLTRSLAAGLLISCAAFGLAHAYQGWSGMLRAAALGALLTWPVAKHGSLYPSMAAHFLIDAVALAWLGPRFLKSEGGGFHVC